ncbi:DMT family transporter [Bacillus sp. CMF21]|uniref:DMT family transporter n=1 Tax=Metabacillus dongyingensis TaxID=2874282 RepID=UPI001CBD138C|nr:DMT family transporter [Metabacillus dongyingensis]UAL53383.1 DMT family transporter [Metabacillus dongyingensis]USK29705.1 DMT family transporter [Bacillus sp. CMF21]
MRKSIHVTAGIYAAVSISFWGISFVSTKAVLVQLEPFTLLVLRFGIASLFLFLLLFLFRQPLKIKMDYLPEVFILAVLGIFVHQVIQAAALKSIQASEAGWIISFSPIFTAVLASLFLKETFTLFKAAGMSIAVLGVLLITSYGQGGSLTFHANMGYALMILSTLNWAVYSILIKKLKIPYPALTITFYTSLIGFLMTIPFFMRNNGWVQLTVLTQENWTHLLFLGIFVSAVAYWFWGKALEVMEAAKVSSFLYFEPLATVIAAVILLNEPFLLMSGAGGLLIIAGVMIVNRKYS